jgi:hypothetical protein
MDQVMPLLLPQGATVLPNVPFGPQDSTRG